MKNRLYFRSKLSEYRTWRVCECFVEMVPGSKAANETRLSERTVCKIYRYIRENLLYYLPEFPELFGGAGALLLYGATRWQNLNSSQYMAIKKQLQKDFSGLSGEHNREHQLTLLINEYFIRWVTMHPLPFAEIESYRAAAEKRFDSEYRIFEKNMAILRQDSSDIYYFMGQARNFGDFVRLVNSRFSEDFSNIRQNRKHAYDKLLFRRDLRRLLLQRPLGS